MGGANASSTTAAGKQYRDDDRSCALRSVFWKGESMLDGFEIFDVEVNGTAIHGRRGGEGPPVLLLHGIPQTHLMWHRVAPTLAEEHTVVLTDLRGFGNSGKPPSRPDHSPYSMRELARDQVAAMRALGYPRFAVAGHDRGARCAYRMALDSPAVVERLAVLDIIPTGEAFGRADREFSLGFWIWSFLAAPEPVPERLIGSNPAVVVEHMLDSWSAAGDVFPAELRGQYIEQFSHGDTVHAICEQYRAAATIDFEQDQTDRRMSNKIRCPVLALWSASGPIGAWYDALEVWRDWAIDVRGRPIQAGHFLPEEAPREVATELLTFFSSPGRPHNTHRAVFDH